MKKISFITLFILFIFGLNANAQKKTFTETVNGVSFKMIYVEGGTFTMGATPELRAYASEIEYPAHRVTISSYFIGETEVTQELWMAVMKDNPSEYKSKYHPVNHVTWNDANDFCKELSKLTGKRYCLPTEAQWENAARGGKYSKRYIFSGSNNINEVAWNGEVNGTTHKVKLKKPNELGLYDMTGNVSEIIYDQVGREYTSASVYNPIGECDNTYVFPRGGSYCDTRISDLTISCRGSMVGFHGPMVGFRIALIPEDVNTERDGYEWVSLKGESNLCGAQVGGKVVVPAEYSEVEYMPYYGGYFLVGNGRYLGVYDCTGKYLIPLDRCYSSIYKTCSDGRYYYRVGKGNKYGACDLNGVEIVKPIYHDLILYNGVFVYRDGNNWSPLTIGIDSNNEVVENPQYTQATQINYDIALKQAKLEEAFGKDVKVEQVVTNDGRRAFKIVFENQILFEFGKSTLNAQAIKYIEQVATALKTLTSINVKISGYTDNVGSLESNKRVSNNRAKAVSDRLALLGISRSRLSSQGVPLADYVATNETEEGRALNRRVEIVIEPTE